MKRLLISIALLLTLTSVALAKGSRPKLVVGIVVEGLSTDYLDLLHDQFLDGGFNHLRTAGLSLENIDYGPGVDASSATAIAVTGAPPSVNGIAAYKRYDKVRKCAFPTFHDGKTLGNFTDETYSLEPLKVSTIADELRVDSRGEGRVVSVALQHDRALLLSGHAGNGAYWISDATGNWATTTYYPDMSAVVSNRNYRMPLKERLDTMRWTPLFAPSLLPGLSEQKRVLQFKHVFAKSDPDRYIAFKASALGNTEVTDLAVDLINDMNMGAHIATDMINVAYTVAPYSYGLSADCSIETLDAYIRLDRDINRLLNVAKRKAGEENVIVFLVGVPAASHDKRDAEHWRIPFGEFSVRKALSLANIYLMAMHGNGNWITDYYDGHFYLNHQLITDRQLDLATLRAQTAEFLSRMSGVAEAYTIDDVIGLRLGENAAAIKRNMVLSASGDVIIDVAPGWEITDAETTSRPLQVVQRKAPTVTPAFIVGPTVKPLTVNRSVDARRLAPTIARYMWLRAPNGASLPPIR